MPDFTPALSKALDVRRRVFHGELTTLSLLDFARPGLKGYDILVVVADGWHLHSGKDIGELMVLEVAEKDAVTREKLNKAVAFKIFIPGISEPAKVWIMEGEDPRKAPTYPNKRIWVFTVKPSGEAA